LNPEDGTNRLSRNVGKRLLLPALLQFSGLWFFKYESVHYVDGYYSFGETCCFYLRGNIV